MNHSHAVLLAVAVVMALSVAMLAWRSGQRQRPMPREYRTARLRLKRAITHGESLSRLWNAIPNNDLLTLKPQLDPTGYGRLLTINVGAVPDEVSLLLGEFLYQLRSALDACIYQATVYATGKNPPPDENKLEFPITWDSKEWPRLEKRRLSELPVGVRDGIEKVQPFHSLSLSPEQQVTDIGRSIGILNDLARKDRHRQLHIMGSWPLEMHPSFDFPDGVTLAWFKTKPSSLIREGTVIAEYQLNGFSSGMPISVRANLSTNIAWNEPPEPCHPSDTFDTRLVEMVNAVGSIIEAFEKQF